MNRPSGCLFTVKEIAVLGLFVAFLEAGKRFLDAIPNVEVITLFLIVFTVYFGKKTIAAALVFTACEVAFWGVHVWVIMYLYIWPLLILISSKIGKGRPVLVYSIFSGVFGLCFGALASVPYLFIGGPATMFAWWVAGIPYDIIHCISNFTLCLFLYRPLSFVMEKAMGFIYPAENKSV